VFSIVIVARKIDSRAPKVVPLIAQDRQLGGSCASRSCQRPSVVGKILNYGAHHQRFGGAVVASRSRVTSSRFARTRGTKPCCS
jgi:hypothetical protein